MLRRTSSPRLARLDGVYKVEVDRRYPHGVAVGV